jgi:hypothetical protein
MLDVLVIAALIVLAGAVLVIALHLRRFLQRYDQFRQETAAMFANQQDIVANHESRLQVLGSRGNAIPTAAEVQEGRWLR